MDCDDKTSPFSPISGSALGGDAYRDFDMLGADVAPLHQVGAWAVPSRDTTSCKSLLHAHSDRTCALLGGIRRTLP